MLMLGDFIEVEELCGTQTDTQKTYAATRYYGDDNVYEWVWLYGTDVSDLKLCFISGISLELRGFDVVICMMSEVLVASVLSQKSYHHKDQDTKHKKFTKLM